MQVLRVLCAAAAAAAVIAGCSSSGTGPASGAGNIPTFKIDEYVGNGHGGPKPSPLTTRPADALSAMSTALGWGKPPQARTTAKYAINWFRVPGGNVSQPVIVTMQPTANEDADLYVLKGGANQFGSSADDCLGYSARTPTAGSDGAGGYSPDWVAFVPGSQGLYPGAQVAAWGVDPAASAPHFTIEVDKTILLKPNDTYLTVGPIPPGDSRWFRFQAAVGTQYTVAVYDVTTGDPDLYVYGNASTTYAGGNTTAGGGSVVFTATASGWHYIRVYSYGASGATYRIRVDSP